jgi:hypothetical protein
MGHDPSPALQVRQPPKHAVGGVDDIELQVEQGLPGDLADLVDLIGAQAGAARFETFQVVEAGGLVDRGPLLPERLLAAR